MKNQGEALEQGMLETNMSFELEMKGWEPGAMPPEQSSLIWQHQALLLLDSGPVPGTTGVSGQKGTNLNDLTSLTMSKLIDTLPSKHFEGEVLPGPSMPGTNGAPVLGQQMRAPLTLDQQHATALGAQGADCSRPGHARVGSYDQLGVDSLITTLSKATVDDSPPGRSIMNPQMEQLQSPPTFTPQHGLPFITDNAHMQLPADMLQMQARLVPPPAHLPRISAPVGTVSPPAGLSGPPDMQGAPPMQMLHVHPGNMLPGNMHAGSMHTGSMHTGGMHPATMQMVMPMDPGAVLSMLNMVPGAPAGMPAPVPGPGSPSGSDPSSGASLQDRARQQQQLAASGLKRKLRSARAELTFEEYEGKYGVSSKCDSGPCADHCSTPCKAHTCRCCKKNRRMEASNPGRGVKGYCGYCLRREKVEGLEFVRCCHTNMVDGQKVRCGVEMLKEVFDNHWKQHKNDANPKFEEVDTDEGRSCRACTNMRPISFYPSQDTNCSCNHCQMVKSKGGRSGNGRDGPEKPRRYSTPISGTGPNIFSGFPAAGDPSPRCVSPSNLGMDDVDAQPGMFGLDGAGVGQRQPGGMGTLTPQFGDAAVAPPNFGSAPSLPVTPFSLNPMQSTEQLVQQARMLLDGAYVNVSSAGPSISLLVTKLQAAAGHPQQAGAASDPRAVLQPLVDVCRTIQEEVQQLMAKCAHLS